MKATTSVARQAAPVYSPAGAIVGTIDCADDGRVLLMKYGLDPSRHMLRNPPGWALDAAHLEQLRAAGGVGVRIETTDGAVWEAPLAVWDRHGTYFDRNHGLQIVLGERYWRRHSRGERQLSLFEAVA